jgi:hypothetical protein
MSRSDIALETMLSFNLTFNKLASDLFFSAPLIRGIRVDPRPDCVFFQASATLDGDDVWPLEERSRGGAAITLTGERAQAFLTVTGLGRDDHLTIKMSEGGWLAGLPWKDADKPPKTWPNARLWKIEGVEVEPVNLKFVHDEMEFDVATFNARVYSSSTQQDAQVQTAIADVWDWCVQQFGEARAGKPWGMKGLFVPQYSVTVGSSGTANSRTGGHFEIRVLFQQDKHASQFKRAYC